MNAPLMINVMETDRVLCDACLEDLWHDNAGDYNPHTWLHARITWYRDAVCDCCEAAHPDKVAHRHDKLQPLTEP
jgi:hypothetical protein